MNSPADEKSDLVIWIISTGTEILQGHYADRNAPWLSARLMALGFSVARHMAIADRLEALTDALSEAAARADLVITTGGLGPTVDDLNRHAMARVWGVELIEDAATIERIRARFRRRDRVMPDSNRVQALIPRGATILVNDNGTAPGFYLRPAPSGPRATLCALPGPPREMQPMFDQRVAPLLLEQFAAGRRVLRTLTFHTIGIPESHINEQVKDLLDADPRVNLALLAKLGQVDVRLTLMGAGVEENRALEQTWRGWIHDRIGADNIYGEDDATPEQVVGELLRARRQTLAVAESCTGGLLSGRLTDIPGASDYFVEGFVTYANEAKMARLGVTPQLLVQHGAVSAEVAEAMAVGARRAAPADWAVSVTGIAGPGGGSPDKPVGLVYLGLASPEGPARSFRHQFLGGREDVRFQTTSAALELLRRALLGLSFEPSKAPGTIRPD